MNNIQRISFCEERNELILPIIGLTLSESNIFLKNGIRTLIVNKKGEKKYFDFVSRGFNLELCDLFPNFKKILVVKNPYWSVLETYLKRYCYVHSILKLHFTFRESVIQDIIEVNYPEDLTQFDDFFIIENYKSEHKRIFGLENNDEIQCSDRFTQKFSNYHTSQKTLSEFYDNDIAEIIYQKFNQYFVKFGYDQYSYLDYHSPVDKIHALHGNQTNIFHL
jgi:hypothetical protein